ncbi:MAG TPA: hypothetical protein VM101_14200 [Flavitalea sp.]|nr:hypothetical protein [Flavitalea sp.]
MHKTRDPFFTSIMLLSPDSRELFGCSRINGKPILSACSCFRIAGSMFYYLYIMTLKSTGFKLPATGESNCRFFKFEHHFG